MTRKICTKAALIARFSLFYLFYRARNSMYANRAAVAVSLPHPISAYSLILMAFNGI